MSQATRAPLPPPFPVGTRLRYVGAHTIGEYIGGYPRGERVDVQAPGLLVEVVSVRPGRRGTGRLVDLHDDEEPFVDETSDGWSVVKPVGELRVHGRCIGPDNRDDYEAQP